MPKSPAPKLPAEPVSEAVPGAGPDDLDVADADVADADVADADVADADVADSGVADADGTALDGADFLEANRRQRARIRDDADRKAQRRGRATRDGDDPDRTPRKLGRGTPSPRIAVPAGRRSLRIAGSRRLFVLVAILVAMILGLAVSTGVLAWQLADARSSAAGQIADEDRGAVLDAAKKYATTLVTYDAADYGDLDRRIREISTPSFAKTFIASSQDARAGNANAKGTSTAAAGHAGIESMSADHAVVLVSLDQRVTSPEVATQVPDGIPYQSRALVTLTRVDGRWLLDGFEVDN